MLSKVELAKIFKIISKCYSNFDPNDSEKLDIWYDELREFNFELLKKIISERLQNKDQGKYAPNLFDLLHDCRNKLSLEKIKKLNEAKKIAEQNNLFAEKQIDALYCDYLYKTNPFQNNYYQKITLEFVEKMGGWNFIVSEFDKNIRVMESPHFKFKATINLFKSTLFEKFLEFLNTSKHDKISASL